MADASNLTPEPTFPHPPRFRWMRRCAVFSALFFLVLAAGWITWSWRARHELNRTLFQIAARGEPVWIDELNPKVALPDGVNAAYYIMRAGSAASTTTMPPAQTSLMYPDYPPYREEWHKRVAAADVANARALSLIRTARDFTLADWGTRFTTPAGQTTLPSLNAPRALSLLASDTAMHLHLQGNDTEAIERIRDILHIAQIVEARPLIITHLVAIGDVSIAASRVMVVAPALTISPVRSTPDVAAASSTPANRAQLRALIDELLDDGPSTAKMVESIRNERAYTLDNVKWATSSLVLMQPLIEHESVLIANHATHAADAVSQPTLGAARVILAKDDAYPFSKGSKGKQTLPQAELLRRMFWSSLDRFVEFDMRSRAERRMAAVSLAVRMYRVDHDQQWPASLAELTPAYLKAVPVDPMSPTGKPLGYIVLRGALPDGGDRPIVYSVGRDGVDDTASDPNIKLILPIEPCYSPGRSIDRDDWRDLSRWSPPIGTRESDFDPTLDAPPAPEDAAGADPSTQPGMSDDAPFSRPTGVHESDQPDDHRQKSE